jgi:hypothetical protein
MKWEWQAIVWVHVGHVAFLYYRSNIDSRATEIKAKHAYILDPVIVRRRFVYL